MKTGNKDIDRMLKDVLQTLKERENLTSLVIIARSGPPEGEQHIQTWAGGQEQMTWIAMMEYAKHNLVDSISVQRSPTVKDASDVTESNGGPRKSVPQDAYWKRRH